MPRSAPARPAPAAKTLPASSPDRVAAVITRGLLRREYLVGQRLVEADLTARLGVGRSTVREALKILASHGVVEIIPHRGAVVRGLTAEDARNLLAVLEVLTGLAARLAAGRIDLKGHAAAFTAAAKPLVEPRPAADLPQLLEERARFYQVMLEIAGNPELVRALPSWQAHLFRTQFFTLLTRADLDAMTLEYREIADAVLAGDGHRAEKAARRHIERTGERTLPRLARPGGRTEGPLAEGCRSS
ncbi:GntR family transcriptional regulator [Ramlibacter sp. MAHUQ-53]|uniref:GntR family transcriptional regulator n=1 Tax=unclassified Ramlibacter TaxID=2617605 RepID=UPI00362F7867